MQNGSRYIPPALRQGGAEGAPIVTAAAPVYDERPEYGGGGGGYAYNRGPTNTRWGGDTNVAYGAEQYYGGGGGGGGAGYDGGSRGGGGFYNRGGYGGGGYGSYGGGGYGRGSYDNRGGYGGGGGDSRGYGGDSRGGYGGGYDRGSGGGWNPSGGDSRSYAPRVDERGYHGDTRPNPKVEQELFHLNDSQTAGINFDKYDDIPVEVSVGCPEPYSEFTVETVGEQLMKNLTLMKFVKPTPVQKYSIPIGITGGDMMACAQTGSGKTAGFLFPVLIAMLRTGAAPQPDARRKATFPSALILAPTRELASQIYDEAVKFAYCTGIRPVVVYGGANIQNQQRELDRGADILVATPGRLVDLIERGRIKLDIIRFLVLDEADRMLDMGFEPQIRRIVEQEGMPLSRQTFMFSATFPVEIQRLAADFMKDYIFVAVGRVGAASKDVTQRVEWVEQTNKVNFTVDFLKRAPKGLILIFVETKRGADYLEECLIREHFAACSIHGDKSQREREDALKAFKSARAPILVATDVAARGLDIPNVVQVINFDLPTNIDDYVHRIGRTGRVGNIGNALSLMNEKNRGIGRELAELLIENDQDCPEWLERMTNSGGGSGGRGRGRGRGGGRFGAKDFRREKSSGSSPAFVPPTNSWASAAPTSGPPGTASFGPPASSGGRGAGWVSAAPAAAAARGAGDSRGGDKSAW